MGSPKIVRFLGWFVDTAEQPFSIFPQKSECFFELKSFLPTFFQKSRFSKKVGGKKLG